MEPSPKKRKLAPKITNPDPISPTAVNSTLHTNTTSYPSEPVSLMSPETGVRAIVPKNQTDSRHSSSILSKMLLRQPLRLWRPILSAMISSLLHGTCKMLPL